MRLWLRVLLVVLACAAGGVAGPARAVTLRRVRTVPVGRTVVVRSVTYSLRSK